MKTLQNQTVNSIIDILKILKSDDILMIHGSSLVSSNKLFSYAKTTEFILDEFNNGLIYCYFIPDIYAICDKNLFSVDMDMYGNLYIWLNGESQPIIIMNIVVPPDGINLIYKLSNFVKYDHFYDDITDDPDIVRLSSMLAKDGVVMYRKNGYIMSLYKGLLPINKGDKLSLSIYNDKSTDKLKYFTSKFTVYKKKKIVIDVYITYRFL
jgi:hypothetical protein